MSYDFIFLNYDIKMCNYGTSYHPTKITIRRNKKFIKSSKRQERRRENDRIRRNKTRNVLNKLDLVRRKTGKIISL
jgi:hypothetical protein